MLNYFKQKLINEKDIKIARLEQEAKNESKIVDKNQKIYLALDRVFDFRSFTELRASIDRIFDKTKVDRFLILIAINGKTDFNVVSVIFEQHNGHHVNAISKYRNVEIDDPYRQLLKYVEKETTVYLEVEKMESCFLKDFYQDEKVTFSDFRFLTREKIDPENDLLLFSTAATHHENSYTRIERSIIKSEYEGTIKPILERVIH